MNLKKPDKIPASCIAVFGTGSDVGKSIVATALCRFFANKGVKVAPFKAQNMSNNSGITPEGLEIGRAQIVQAEAAGIAPHVDMNPILLKPTTEIGAQVVLLGKVLEDSSAIDYHRKKERLFSTACQALDRLRGKYELIIIEGAGSCAEVNLMPNDIVNFRMAEYAGAPVILVADIHKGGVFAQIVGTLECIPEKYKEMISGFLINRFRGDIRLFEEGKLWIEGKTEKKVFGVLPWYNHINIEAEDSVVIENPQPVSAIDTDNHSIAVIRLPHISNFTDFDPLSRIENIDLYYIEEVQDLSSFAAVIIPGSKNTRFDLNWLIKTGWSTIIIDYARQGNHIIGICGGYQILGKYIHDPDGVEGKPGKTEGLALLPVETILMSSKKTTLTLFSCDGVKGAGYEIHMGQTKRLKGHHLFDIHERNGVKCDGMEGSLNDDLNVMGTYIHGLFDTPGITKLLLDRIGVGGVEIPEITGLSARGMEYDLLAEHFEKHIDTEMIEYLRD
jgi:adenosylcobyric acid synthase